MKIRTIITQDAEVDDQNSLRHFLFYTNEVELQGIIQTSSKFHWIGVPGAIKPQKAVKDDFDFGDGEAIDFDDNGDYDKPYRWPGTDWMWQQIDDYEKDYKNLVKHDPNYPTPDYLRSIIKIGNIGYEGEMEAATEGSNLIKEHILDDDERTLYLQVWGGTNTICRALMDIELEHEEADDWPKLKEKISKKIVITACGEQDPTYRTYMAEHWPSIQFVKTLQMESYAYPWFVNPEGESKDTLKSEFMTKEILNGKSEITKHYCTWLDGNEYEGEEMAMQFGANPNIGREWFGYKFLHLPEPKKYDFLSEGDSPTFFPLLNWGFRTLEDFSYGGIAGRYQLLEGEKNSKGEPLNLWDVSKDKYTDYDGNVTERESMWPYVCDIQRDFASRVDWAATGDFAAAEHAPKLSIEGGLDYKAKAGERVEFVLIAENVDGGDLELSVRVYEEASAASAKMATVDMEKNIARVLIPGKAKTGDKIHLIAKAQADGRHRLVHYQQIIVTVE